MPLANSVAEVNAAASTPRELLRVEDLHAKAVEGEHGILRGFSLTVREGEVHAIMGPNGSVSRRSPARCLPPRRTK